MNESPLGLLIPGSTDPPSPEPIAKNAERADALLQKGGLAASTYIAGPVTRKSTSQGAFSTPINVTIPGKIKAGQLLEVRIFGVVKASIESVASTGGALAVQTSDGANLVRNLGTVHGEALPANTELPFGTENGTLLGLASTLAPAANAWITGQQLRPMIVVYDAETSGSSVTVSLTGSCTGTGTITASGIWMFARVSG